jgi:hypothetical protein
MSETVKTTGFVVVAAVLAVGAALLQPERRTPSILSDQGEIFYPEFKDPRVVKTIEVVDYDESTATARPFKIEQQRGRWIIPSHYSYPVDAGAKLAAIAAGLMNLRKDQVVSDSVQDHVRYGVVDPLDAKTASLQGRGKRVTLRDAGKATVADFILGRKVEGKDGYRYVRLPGQKRVYAVKTDADPSAQFSDWVNSAILRIPAASIRKISILSYSVDERLGGLTNLENVVLTQEGGEWKMAGGAPNPNAVRGLTSTLENLKIVDVRPKPPSLAQGLRDGRIELSLETALSLRQRGFHLAPNGRILANEGEMTVESTGGLAYVLRFGEIATGENRYLFATVSCRGGDGGAGCESQARDLNARFAEWYYVISGADFQRLRLRKKDLGR